MAFIDAVLDRTPGPLRLVVLKHHELIKFAIVGLTTCIFDLVIFYTLTFTVLESKPTVAKIFSGICATILSYILNREWSFKHRGGREKHHEALLFFVISAFGVLIGAFPLWVVNNLLDVREGGHVKQIFVDFVLNYIVGNLLQMIFRYWALRRFAFPDELPKAEPVQEKIT